MIHGQKCRQIDIKKSCEQILTLSLLLQREAILLKSFKLLLKTYFYFMSEVHSYHFILYASVPKFGWIFGKLPKGGGGSFPIQNISLQIFAVISVTNFRDPWSPIWSQVLPIQPLLYAVTPPDVGVATQEFAQCQVSPIVTSFKGAGSAAMEGQDEIDSVIEGWSGQPRWMAHCVFC